MSNPTYKKLLSVLPWFIIAFGIALRLLVFFDNNCLILDEVNVVLNIYDRNIPQLFTPLDHNQFAPPGFLVILKLLSGLLGHSEHIYRLYALVSGIAALWLMLVILKKYVSLHVIWYPLCMMAVGFVYIRYGTLVKQYSADMVVTLSLILLALKYDILKSSVKRLTIIWMLAGTIAIWFSMPSVFVLASVGICYSVVIVRSKEYRRFLPIVLIAVFWLLNFGIYYNILLKFQVDSEYLQGWHHKYFLNVLTTNGEEWEKNWNVVSGLLTSMGGKWTLSIVFHLSTMFIGAVYLLRRNAFKGLLIILPILFCLIAVSMHKYTMLNRVMLFSLPLMLLLIAAGMQVLFNLRMKAVNIVVVICGIICIVNFSQLHLLKSRIEHEEITRNLDFALKWEIKAKNLYVHPMGANATRYYTEIHPERERYKTLKHPHYLGDNADYEQIGANIKERSALLYSFEEQEAMERQNAFIEYYATRIAMNSAPIGWIAIYEKK